MRSWNVWVNKEGKILFDLMDARLDDRYLGARMLDGSVLIKVCELTPEQIERVNDTTVKVPEGFFSASNALHKISAALGNPCLEMHEEQSMEDALADFVINKITELRKIKISDS